jgi:hypothetical protein
MKNDETSWKPEWSCPRETVAIQADDENYETFDDVEVLEEEEGLFRLYETPFLSELRFGDLIRAERNGNDQLWFIEIVGRTNFDLKKIFLSASEALTFTNKNETSLNKLMDAGGLWQLEAGGVLTLTVPPDFDLELT